MLDDVRTALSLVFRGRSYQRLAIVLSALLFAIYISVPVWTIPGNSYGTVLSVIPPAELAGTVLLSCVMGVVLSMQAYAWRNNAHSLPNAGAGLAGLVSGSISVLFSTASCASCMSAVFSFLGFSGIVFFIQHRGEMVLLTFAILGASFYLTSRRIAGRCASCGIPHPQDNVKKREEQESGE
jgi:hypothetical protein